MTFTYSSTSIATDLAKVRLTIGDTDSADALMTDEEINYILSRYDSVSRASMECVKIILAKWTRQTDRQGTGFSASRSQRFQHLKDLLVELKSGGGTLATPTITGASKSDETSVENDTDYVPARFGQGMHSND